MDNDRRAPLRASTHSPCIKRAWVEFSASTPTPPSTRSTLEPDASKTAGFDDRT